MLFKQPLTYGFKGVVQRPTWYDNPTQAFESIVSAGILAGAGRTGGWGKLVNFIAVHDFWGGDVNEDMFLRTLITVTVHPSGDDRWLFSWGIQSFSAPVISINARDAQEHLPPQRFVLLTQWRFN